LTRKQIRKNYKLERKKIKKNAKANKKILKDELKKTKNKAEYTKNLKIIRKNKKTALSTLLAEYVEGVKEVAKITKKTDAPYRRAIEEVGNSITHGIGTIFSVTALILMLIKSTKGIQVFSSIVYFLGLFMMFTMSCLYHSFPYGSTAKRVFRRFDYTSIYLLIGATYAPILLLYLGGSYGIIFFVSQWCIIALGVTLVSVFGPGRLKAVHLILYILLGWSAILFLPQMIKHDLAFFIWILVGGIIYMLGLIPFIIDKKVAHFLWHILVFFGALIQWIGIFIYLF